MSGHERRWQPVHCYPKKALMFRARTPPIVMPCIHFIRASSSLITATSVLMIATSRLSVVRSPLSVARSALSVPASALTVSTSV